MIPRKRPQRWPSFEDVLCVWNSRKNPEILWKEKGQTRQAAGAQGPYRGDLNLYPLRSVWRRAYMANLLPPGLTLHPPRATVDCHCDSGLRQTPPNR